MGNTKSINPVSTVNFDREYVSNSSLLPKEHEAGIANVLLQMIIPRDIFTSTAENFQIAPFQNLCIRGDQSSIRHEIVLEDSLKKVPIAVCKLMFTGLTPFKIYTTKPNFPGQKKSARTYNNNTALYTYAEIRVLLQINQIHLTLKLSDSNKMTLDDNRYIVESMSPVCRVVTRAGKPVALMQTGTWKKSANSVLLTVCSGIDPCLMVCLASICGHLDDIEVRE